MFVPTSLRHMKRETKTLIIFQPKNQETRLHLHLRFPVSINTLSALGKNEKDLRKFWEGFDETCFGKGEELISYILPNLLDVKEVVAKNTE